MLLETLEDGYGALAGCCGGHRRRRACAGCSHQWEPMNKNVNIINFGSQSRSADQSYYAPEAPRTLTIAPGSPGARQVSPMVAVPPKQPVAARQQSENLLARAWANAPQRPQPAVQPRVYPGFWPSRQEPGKSAAPGYWPPRREPGKSVVYRGFESRVRAV